MRSGLRNLTYSALVLGVAACANSAWDAATIDEGSRRWVSVYRDANYRVFVDTANLAERRFDSTHTVWYRADHRAPHWRHGQQWNREVSQALVSCSKRDFKVIRADLSLGNAKPISQQRATSMEVLKQPWREVEPGSADEASMRAACWLIERR